MRIVHQSCTYGKIEAMDYESAPTSVVLQGEVFDVVKPARLLPGMVLRSQSRDVYARLGPKQSALEEQVHTVSLYKRGFPVAQVLSSAEYGEEEWYFIEESLGEKPFHVQFADEWSKDRVVSDGTFVRYADVMQRYITAQFDPANYSTVSATDFVREAVPDHRILANYQICGGDIARYHQALASATDRLTGVPMGVLQLDLNPYNVLDRGIIDFELVSYGPLGYDSLTVSLWHRWFINDPSAKYRLAYLLNEQQVGDIARMVAATARARNIPDPNEYMQEFLLIKTAWGFSSTQSIKAEPLEKQAFYHYRADILGRCVDDYLLGKTIDPFTFPDFRAA